MQPTRSLQWRTPEAIVEVGFGRSRVVMMNEAHDGDLRCIRTRLIGQRALVPAHHAGVRYLAMEALWRAISEEANRTRRLPDLGPAGGYLSQPEMRVLVQQALDLGWTLIPYDIEQFELPTNPDEGAFINWRQEEGARQLTQALDTLSANAKLLVWCGWGHHLKLCAQDATGQGHTMMGYHFRQFSGIDPFVINQVVTIDPAPFWRQFLNDCAPEVESLGGTAGFLTEEARDADKACFTGSPYLSFMATGTDAFLLSTQNKME